MIMGGVGIRDSKKYIVTSGLTLHLDNTSTSYSGLTGITWSDVSGANRRFYSRHSYDAAGKLPIFTKDPLGYQGMEFNGFSAEYVGMPEEFRRGTYYFQENSTPRIDFETLGSWTIEILCRLNGAGRNESGCGVKLSTLWQKMGSGTNNSTQYVFNGHRINFAGVDPFTGSSNPIDTGSLVSCGPIIDGAASETNSYRAGVLSSFFNRNDRIYMSFVFDKRSASVYRFSYYINGSLYHTAADQTFVAAPAGDFLVGGRDNNCGPTEAWRGWIYNVRMYNRVLTAAEIKQNFEAIRGKAGL
jgi:hypothetical protein